METMTVSECFVLCMCVAAVGFIAMAFLKMLENMSDGRRKRIEKMEEAIKKSRKLLNYSLFAHDQCRALNHIMHNDKLCYLIKTSEDAVSNEEHFKHNIEQLIRSYCGILDRNEIEVFYIDVLEKVYGR